MCEKSRHGVLGAPHAETLLSDIEDCQRSGVFVNGTDGEVIVQTDGIAYVVPPARAATVPVSPDVFLRATGRGAVSWTLTTAVLAAQLSEAPAMRPVSSGNGGGEGAAPISTELMALPESESGVIVDLSSGNYHKLVFIFPINNGQAS